MSRDRQSRLEIAEKHNSELTVNLGIAEDTLREAVARMEKDKSEQMERLNIDLNVLRAELEKTRNALREAEGVHSRAVDCLQEDLAAAKEETESLREQSRVLMENVRCSIEKCNALAKENEIIKTSNSEATNRIFELEEKARLAEQERSQRALAVHATIPMNDNADITIAADSAKVSGDEEKGADETAKRNRLDSMESAVATPLASDFQMHQNPSDREIRKGASPTTAQDKLAREMRTVLRQIFDRYAGKMCSNLRNADLMNLTEFRRLAKDVGFCTEAFPLAEVDVLFAFGESWDDASSL